MIYSYISVIVNQHAKKVVETNPLRPELVGKNKIEAFNQLGAQGWKEIDSNKADNMPYTMERDLVLDYTFMLEIN